MSAMGDLGRSEYIKVIPPAVRSESCPRCADRRWVPFYKPGATTVTRPCPECRGVVLRPTPEEPADE